MILVTGADGYVGWPTLLALAEAYAPEEVLGVDHLGRRTWVAEVGGTPLIPIATMAERVAAAQDMGFTNLRFVKLDLRDADATMALAMELRPRVIVHLAAQPSAPYAHLDAAHAAFTQDNNLGTTRNLLWAVHAAGRDRSTHFVVTTTMGIYGASPVEVPEGPLLATIDGREVRLPFPPLATSWYHMGKAMDALNLQLANFLWGQTITELRTAVVLGTRTPLTSAHPALSTRVDADFCFGVVGHRFLAQAVANLPLTVYGEGDQKKPFIALPDAVASIVTAAGADASPGSGLRIYNQTTDVIGIAELAHRVVAAARRRGIEAAVAHRPNPRVEDEHHELRVHREHFLAELLPSDPFGLDRALEDAISDLAARRDDILRLGAMLSVSAQSKPVPPRHDEGPEPTSREEDRT